MICKKCNKEIQDGLQYCTHCGCETGYKATKIHNGRKLGVYSLIFSFDLTILGFILGIIGLFRGIKCKDKLSIILNSLGIVISVVCTIVYALRIMTFIETFTSLLS